MTSHAREEGECVTCVTSFIFTYLLARDLNLPWFQDPMSQDTYVAAGTSPPSPAGEPLYLTVAALADLVGVSSNKTITRWSLESRSMPVLRHGRTVRFPPCPCPGMAGGAGANPLDAFLGLSGFGLSPWCRSRYRRRCLSGATHPRRFGGPPPSAG